MNKVVLDETKLRKAMKDALSFDLLVKHTKLRASIIDKALRGYPIRYEYAQQICIVLGIPPEYLILN